MAALVVAIQGERGAFSHQAAIESLGAGIEILPRTTFDELFDSVVEKKADRALVPIENSLHGSIHENYDRLKNRPLHIVGETQLRIRQCLIGRPGSSVATIRRVASHPVALAQCRRFFAERPQVEAVSAYDTAGAVQDLMKGGLATQGAIASRLAAELYGGHVLLEGIEDDPENYTRFLLLAREAGHARGGDQDLDRVRARQQARRALPRARRLRRAQPRPLQARVASAARAPLGALVLPRRDRRPARVGRRGDRGAGPQLPRAADPGFVSRGPQPKRRLGRSS